MAQKSKHKPKPKPKPKPKQAALPLADARWMPIREAYKRIDEVVGSPYLAAHDLFTAISAEEVRSMRRKLFRSYEGPERQLNDRNYWTPFMLNQAGEVVHNMLPNPTPVTDFVFYVWGPDITKRWPEPKRAAGDAGDPSTTERRKPGPQPRHDWPTVVARELIRRAKAGEKDPTGAELAQFCLNKWDWQPDISALQKLLKQLLG